ncbi:MAG: TonB-dependent receptor [Cohaesibacter sp.]|nr:TonB-dependent receptor [Cohaesibacter sp.]
MKMHLWKNSLLLVSVSSLALATSMAQIAKAQEAEQLDKIVVVNPADEKDLETDKVITSEEIERLNAQDLGGLFASEPAITVTSGSTAVQKFYLHGIDQAKVHVTIDGARQKNPVWHHVGNFNLDPYFLKQADVKSGVSPADAGPGALAGSVEMTTKDASDLLRDGQSIGGRVIAGYESNSQTFTVTGAGYGKSETGFEVLGIVKRADGDDYKDGAGRKEPGTADDLWSGLGKVAYESGEGHRVTLSGEYSRDYGYRKLRANMALANPARENLYNENIAERASIVLNYETTKPTELFDPQATLYFSQHILDRPYGAYRRGPFLSPAGDFKSDNNEFGGKLLNTFTFGKASVTAGVDFYHNQTDIESFYKAVVPVPDASETVANIGALVQARFSPIERLEISTGARVDYQSYDSVDGQTFETVGLSPNLSASFEVLDGLKLNAGFASVFGGLEQAEAARFHALNYKYSSDLKPTRSHNSELGFSFRRNGWDLGGKLFYTHMENPIDYGNYNFRTRVADRINGQDLKSYGFDLYGRYDWDNAFVSAAFSHTEVKFGDGYAGSGHYNTANSVGDMLTLQGAYTFTDYDVTVGALAKVAFDYDKDIFDNSNRKFEKLEGYEVVDIFAEWKPKTSLANLSLRAEVTNLFDQDYAERGSYQTVPGVIGSIHSPGRSFNIKLGAEF